MRRWHAQPVVVGAALFLDGKPARRTRRQEPPGVVLKYSLLSVLGHAQKCMWHAAHTYRSHFAAIPARQKLPQQTRRVVIMFQLQEFATGCVSR
jgi:hypothetical protein